MRVSSRGLYYNVNLQLGNIAEQLRQINEQIASQKRINKPSDDPIGITQALRLKKVLSQIGQYEKNIQHGQSWLSITDSALQTVNGLVVRGKEIANQMATGTYNGDQRSNAAQEIKNIIAQLVQVGNTKLTGRYIFSGYQENTAPFTDTGSYNGDEHDMEIAIGSSAQMKINLTGTTVFGEAGDTENNIFDILVGLRDSLENNNVEGIQVGLDQLNNFQPRVVGNMADVGSRLNRIDMCKNILSDLDSNYTERLSDIEDLDVVKAINDLNMKQTAYKAVLYSVTQISSLSLVDFLR